MGAASGSLGASAVFPLNLLVVSYRPWLTDSEHDYKLKEQQCCHMSTTDYGMSFVERSNMKDLGDYLKG